MYSPINSFLTPASMATSVSASCCNCEFLIKTDILLPSGCKLSSSSSGAISPLLDNRGSMFPSAAWHTLMSGVGKAAALSVFICVQVSHVRRFSHHIKPKVLKSSSRGLKYTVIEQIHELCLWINHMCCRLILTQWAFSRNNIMQIYHTYSLLLSWREKQLFRLDFFHQCSLSGTGIISLLLSWVKMGVWGSSEVPKC